MSRFFGGLGRAVNLKPPYLALGGISLTIVNMAIGNLLVAHISAGIIREAIKAMLIASTVVVPPLCLGVLLLHYKSSAASLRGIVSLYLSLIVICATIDLDMMIHFSHSGGLPFQGMPSMWDFPAGSGMAIDWPSFLVVVVDCLHFSVETLSTVGYGDIVPVTWFAKMAVDIQVLMGLGITVLAVGTHFSARKATDAAAFCPRCGNPLDLSAHPASERSQPERRRIHLRG